MMKLLKNKKGEAGSRPLELQMAKALTEGAKSKGRRGRNLLSSLGHWLAGTNLPETFAKTIKTIFSPVTVVLQAVFHKVLLTTTFATAVIFVLAFLFFWTAILTPWYEVYAEDNEIDNFIVDMPKHIWEDVLVVQGWRERWDSAEEELNWQIRGQFVAPEHGRDTTIYGIYLPKITPRKSDFGVKDKIVVIAQPTAQVLGDTKGNVKVYCSLEDGVHELTTPTETIPTVNIAGVTIQCVFSEMPITTDNTKEATISLVYPFSVTATLPVSVMDGAKHDSFYQSLLRDNNHDVIQTLTALANAVNPKVDPKERAVTKITPVEVGAKITEFQPIATQYGFNSGNYNLRVSVVNRGKGMVQSINNMTIYTGELGLTLFDQTGQLRSGTSLCNHCEVSQDYLASLGSFNVGHDFVFEVSTSGFKLDDNQQKDVTTTRVIITVDYTYNVTAKTNVDVPSCRDYPCVCEPCVEVDPETDEPLPGDGTTPGEDTTDSDPSVPTEQA